MVFLITWDYSFMLIQILPIVKKYFAYQLSNVTIVKATVIICFVKCCTQQTCSALNSLRYVLNKVTVAKRHRPSMMRKVL